MNYLSVHGEGYVYSAAVPSAEDAGAFMLDPFDCSIEERSGVLRGRVALRW